MTELKALSSYISIKYPTTIYKWDKLFWTKPKLTDVLGAIDINDTQVVYKTIYLQKEFVAGFEVFEAKHTLKLVLKSGETFETQFEDEQSYNSAVETLEHTFLS